MDHNEKKHSVVFASVIVLIATGCAIDDADRCPDGLVYLPDSNACACPENTTFDIYDYTCVENDTGGGDTGEGDTDSETTEDEDAGADSGAGSNDGFGESCTSSDQCAAYDVANFCVVNPLTQEGTCTVDDCVVADCPDEWQCCDCVSISFFGWRACIPADYAAQAIPLGCVCEGG